MNNELTTNTPREKLDEVTVMGRRVYVSQSSKEAYVEFQDELVSMTNLRAWNILMEKAKQEAIEGYTQEQTLAEKELERTTKDIAGEIRDMAMELHRKADKVERSGDTDE